MLRHLATLLLALALGATGLHARGGGGCLQRGTLVDTPVGPVPVENLRVGDTVWGWVNGERAPATVQAVYAVEPESYVELSAGPSILRLTPEHPVQVGPGVFLRADRLQPNQLLARAERDLFRETPVTLTAARTIPADAPAYNLMVSPGGVFFANGLAVHNKGCFLPDTPVTMADGSRRAISMVQAGDAVLAFDSEGKIVNAAVHGVLTHEVTSYLVLRTERIELRVTEEHPFYVGAGTFKTAEALHTGDTVFVYDGATLAPQHVLALERVEAKVTVYNLQTDEPHTFLANGVAVHNKGGGCFAAGTLVATPDGPRAIETLQLGNTVLAPDAAGRLGPARVVGIYLNYTPLLVLHTDRGTLRTTDEHPLLDANGNFRAADSFATGARLGRVNGNARVASVERGTTDLPVYTLSVSGAHTFVADGFVVHNKGGGCFAAGTLVATPTAARAIETLQLGDIVLAPGRDGANRPVAVEGVYLNYAPLLILHTDRGSLRTTDEHPLLGADGEFHAAGEFGVGAIVMRTDGPARVISIEHGPTDIAVYTLSVGAPHTFIADGFVAHNKGGFGGGGFHGSSGGHSGTGDDMTVWVFFGVILIFIFVVQHLANQSGGSGGGDDEELDYCFSRNQINGKAVKTLELLRFISRTDAAWNPDDLRARAREVFVELQGCWTARDYAPMEPLMMHDLYEEHCAQLRGLQQTHEINRIEGLTVDAIDIVQVNYTQNKAGRAFAALITARARDYYVDDRSQNFLRGDERPAQFQEFWTFQLCDGVWKLREIEQSKESDLLTTENFFEPFTDTGRDQVYGDAAGTSGPAGPALPEAVQSKAQKIDRLLNFLVQTDKLWNRDAMLATARRVFTNLELTWQDGRPEMLTGIDIEETFAAELRANLEANQRNDLKIELRNFCVRKIEIVLVNNRDDRTADEFTARITAHAQTIMTRAGVEIRRDEYVKPWTDFWTFGRNRAGTGWSLRAIEPEANGGFIIARENTDEGSSQEMLQWYYSKTRAT